MTCKISLNNWIPFIQIRFSETGKMIGQKDAGLIAEFTDCYPYYVQQLAQKSWLRTETVCSGEIIEKSFHDLVLQLSMLFQNLTDGLSRTQSSFLKALTENVDHLSSQRTIQEYQLGTSANVVKIKKIHIYKEIIDIFGKEISFLDPLYKAWLMEYFFKDI
jgi:hypothetical protein